MGSLCPVGGAAFRRASRTVIVDTTGSGFVAVDFLFHLRQCIEEYSAHPVIAQLFHYG